MRLSLVVPCYNEVEVIARIEAEHEERLVPVFRL